MKFQASIAALVLGLMVNIFCGAQAHAWTKVVDCKGLIVDQASANDKSAYQITFSGEVLQYFLTKGAVQGADVSGQTEVVYPMNKEAKQLVAYQGAGTYAYFVYRLQLTTSGNVLVAASLASPGTPSTPKAAIKFAKCNIDPALKASLQN